jgi:hypothetical protein
MGIWKSRSKYHSASSGDNMTAVAGDGASEYRLRIHRVVNAGGEELRNLCIGRVGTHLVLESDGKCKAVGWHKGLPCSSECSHLSNRALMTREAFVARGGSINDATFTASIAGLQFVLQQCWSRSIPTSEQLMVEKQLDLPSVDVESAVPISGAMAFRWISATHGTCFVTTDTADITIVTAGKTLLLHDTVFLCVSGRHACRRVHLYNSSPYHSRCSYT